MKCFRCQGLMVTITLVDAERSTSMGSLPAWRCLTCGEVLDAGIVNNRKQPVPPAHNLARPPGSLPVAPRGSHRKQVRRPAL